MILNSDQTTSIDQYILELHKDQKRLKLVLRANDSGHAQAQAADIARALNAESYNLGYGACKTTALSELFENLATNNYTHAVCAPWSAQFTNGVPCSYALGSRHYIRNLILKYLDIPKDGQIAKPSCNCKSCINPYHFAYAREKREKISSGDLKLLLAYRRQGVEVTQIAKALNVHRSTIYRKLTNEPISNGSARDCDRAGR